VDRQGSTSFSVYRPQRMIRSLADSGCIAACQPLATCLSWVVFFARSRMLQATTYVSCGQKPSPSRHRVIVVSIWFARHPMARYRLRTSPTEVCPAHWLSRFHPARSAHSSCRLQSTGIAFPQQTLTSARRRLDRAICAALQSASSDSRKHLIACIYCTAIACFAYVE